jgi:hypothetical protein
LVIIDELVTEFEDVHAGSCKVTAVLELKSFRVKERPFRETKAEEIVGEVLRNNL